MASDFYKNLTGFDQFADLTKPAHYTPAPADWYVVATDIKDSTKAIAAGRYKEVNTIGAAGIMALLNIAGDIALPYAFGGDGATMLIPPELLEKAQETLAAVRKKVLSMFELELRGGCIPVQALYDQGASLSIGKYHLSPHIAQAVFQGTALELAEIWLKKGGGTVLKQDDSNNDDPNIQGLECRWQPIENRNGEMISLLVRVTPRHAKQPWDIYSQILQELETIYPEYARSRPAHMSGMHLNFSPDKMATEIKLRGGKTFFSRTLYFLKILCLNSIGQFSFKTHRKALGFDGQKYLSEMVANSDARKFDEMLRMVLDSSPEQHKKLEAMLSARQKAGDIVYGIHVSSQALMTCLVFNLSGNHVHFIDGADGGYALAAVQMKQQASAAG